MRGTFHDRLRALELNGGVESLRQSIVTLARQAAAEVGQPQSVIHFGIAASRHIERQLFRRLLEDVDLERTVFAPACEGPCKRLEGLLAQCREPARLRSGGRARESPGQRFPGSLLADLGGECPEQRAHDFRLDLALLEGVAIPVLEGSMNRSLAIDRATAVADRPRLSPA